MLLCIFMLCTATLSVQARAYGDGTVHAEFHLECNDNEMWVFFNKTKLDERTTQNFNNRDYTIYFQDTTNDGCRTSSNTTTNVDDPTGVSSGFSQSIWVKSNFVDGCEIEQIATEDYIYYQQTVMVQYGNNPDGTVRREEYDHYKVICHRPRMVREKIGGDSYNVTRKLPDEAETNSTANFQFVFGHADTNGIQQSGYALGDDIKFTLSMGSNLQSVKNVIQECWSSNNGSKLVSHSLIRDSCPIDQGTKFLNTSALSSEFTVESYRAMGLSPNNVFVTCIVHVCQHDSVSENCLNCNETARKRRDVGGTSFVGETVVLKTTGFFIIGEEVIKIIEPTTRQEEQSSDSFIEGDGGIAIIVIVAVLLVTIVAVVVKSVFFAAVAPKAAPVTAFSGKGIEY